MEPESKIKAIWLAEEFIFDGEDNCINGLQLIGEPLDLTIDTKEPMIEFTIPKAIKRRDHVEFKEAKQ